jgi:hypothetical protein
MKKKKKMFTHYKGKGGWRGKESKIFIHVKRGRPMSKNNCHPFQKEKGLKTSNYMFTHCK